MVLAAQVLPAEVLPAEVLAVQVLVAAAEVQVVNESCEISATHMTMDRGQNSCPIVPVSLYKLRLNFFIYLYLVNFRSAF